MNSLRKFLRAITLLILRVLRFHSKRIILFESYPELNGSPWMIYQEMLKRGFDKKYKLIWAIDKDFEAPREIKCIPFFGELTSFQKIQRWWYNAQAVLSIENNRPIYKITPSTIRIFTRHGGPLKKCTDYMHFLGKMDYLLTLSPALQELDFIDCKDYCVKNIDNILPLGFPANDQLFEKKDLYASNFYPTLRPESRQNHYSKIIGWLPTFRQHRQGDRTDSEIIFPFGVPLIKTENELVHLNELLHKKNILLAIQMHHAQMANFSKKTFSNIALISQELKYKTNVSTANLMQSFDALITDYSAAYHEYVLLNRPIALSIDDYEEYSSKTGFVFDYFEWIKGVYLKDASDLMRFIEDIANNIDSAQSEREHAAHRIHKYLDNQSTNRVINFLIEKVKL